MSLMDIKFFRYVRAMKDLYSGKNKFAERTGKRLLPESTVLERLEICRTCDQFNGHKCEKCGCCTGALSTHFNKLAFPTEACPLGKWSVET